VRYAFATVFAGALALATPLSLSGCGGPEKEPAPAPKKKKEGGGGGRATANAPAAALQRPIDQSKEALLVEARKRQLMKEDFTESDANRDPFRSFLSTFAVQVTMNKSQHKIVLDKFALDELKLIAIITGELPAKAMFVDPSGKGVTVSRGDHVSKVDAVITRIAPDRVFFRIEEDSGTDKQRNSERVIELHAGEAATQ
jgi:type IV pilus assembly protein PilP